MTALFVALPARATTQANKVASPAKTLPAQTVPRTEMDRAQPTWTVGSDIDVLAIEALLTRVLSASNAHQLDALMSAYAPRFVSGDHLTLKQVRNLIEETWKSYPAIQYVSKPLVIRVAGDWASVESIDSAKADIAASRETADQPGVLESHSRGMLHLQRIGTDWKIIGDTTLFESATIRYGSAKDMVLTLASPEQVAESAPYSAKLDVELAEGTFAVATIAKDPIVFPQPQPEERFRTLSSDRATLERVFEANGTHHNELVTATLGITTVSQDKENRPQVSLTGLATIVRRVNVIPQGQALPLINEDPAFQQVRISADGRIQVEPPQQANPKQEAHEAMVKPPKASLQAPVSGLFQAPVLRHSPVTDSWSL